MEKMTFGEKLRHARMMQGLTQTGLATKIGLSQQAICNFEKDNRKTVIRQSSATGQNVECHIRLSAQ